MDASQARQQTQDAIANQFSQLEDMVMGKISDAVKRGDYSVMVSVSGKSAGAKSALLEMLRAAGYSVKESDSGDQRDYGYVTISWLTPPEVSE